MRGGALADGAGGQVDHGAVLEEGEVALEVQVRMSWDGEGDLDGLE